MELTHIGATALQVIGGAYLLGGVFAAHLATVRAPVTTRRPTPPSPASGKPQAIAWQRGTPRPGAPLPSADDPGRQGWRLASALMVMFAGAAMVALDEAAPAILAALLVQQIFYLVRQRIAEMDRARASDAVMQRPSVLTVRVFLLTSACALGAAVLQVFGALH